MFLLPYQRSIGGTFLSRSLSSSLFGRSFSSIQDIKSEFCSLGNGEVTWHLEGEIAILKFHNPSKKNAFSGKMMSELHDASLLLSNHRFKGLLFYSEDDFFCSGGDLTTVKQIGTSEQGLKMSKLMHDATDRLSRLPAISVSYIQGRAIGGGAEISLWSDFRLAHPTKAEFAFVQARMGLITGWGGGTRLIRLLGKTQALNILLSCERISSIEAKRLNLIQDNVSSIEEAKTWLLNKVSSIDYEVIKALKELTNGEESLIVHRYLEIERSLFSPLWGGSANLNALTSNIKHR